MTILSSFWLLLQFQSHFTAHRFVALLSRSTCDAVSSAAVIRSSIACHPIIQTFLTRTTKEEEILGEVPRNIIVVSELGLVRYVFGICARVVIGSGWQRVADGMYIWTEASFECSNGDDVLRPFLIFQIGVHLKTRFGCQLRS